MGIVHLHERARRSHAQQTIEKQNQQPNLKRMLPQTKQHFHLKSGVSECNILSSLN